ncbi:helicase associated domain-containing protein [uncultured Arthrobacter sp.]|uniref:helicase associated domain-containing protein n=1 Tax=uncultured Arthrobacter sp. TaxID=114050 RepID=UPI002632115E|nr:helicase associated domain-containing protein [uncultured Arthrobacter sp.]
MIDDPTDRAQRAGLSWKRHLEDLAAFHAHYGRTPSSIRPVNAGEERLARWWHRQLVAAGRQTLTAEQACLLDNLFSPDALDDLDALEAC